MMPASGLDVSRSTVKWVVTIVLTTVVGLATFAVTGTVGDLKRHDIALDTRTEALERGDGRYETRITLLESHYSDIHEELKQIHQELQDLNARGRRPFGNVQSGQSTRAVNYDHDDVLNGNP